MEEPIQPEKPKPEQRWQDGKRPLNVRPRRSEPRQVEFIEGLISETGSAQNALAYCIDQAMSKSVPLPGNAEVTHLKQQLKDAQTKYEQAYEQNLMLQHKVNEKVLAPVVPEEMKKQLEKVMRVRKLQEAEAIAYCIKYTAKNDWL